MERHEWNKKLIKFAQEHEIRLDIKVHPVDWKDSFSYFKKMKGNSDDLIRVIAGGSSEAILHNYGLVILDMVPTQVLSSALASDMNIILFKQNEFLYNDERFEDLEKRVHFVEDQEGLNDCLLAFKEGQLINKSNVAFENKYLTAKYGIKDILKRISSD